MSHLNALVGKFYRKLSRRLRVLVVILRSLDDPLCDEVREALVDYNGMQESEDYARSLIDQGSSDRDEAYNRANKRRQRFHGILDEAEEVFEGPERKVARMPGLGR